MAGIESEKHYIEVHSRTLALLRNAKLIEYMPALYTEKWLPTFNGKVLIPNDLQPDSELYLQLVLKIEQLEADYAQLQRETAF